MVENVPNILAKIALKKVPIFADSLAIFALFEILELFEYLVAKYSIFEDELFLLESETLLAIDLTEKFVKLNFAI